VVESTYVGVDANVPRKAALAVDEEAERVLVDLGLDVVAVLAEELAPTGRGEQAHGFAVEVVPLGWGEVDVRTELDK
jgi:hypothetical protein